MDKEDIISVPQARVTEAKHLLTEVLGQFAPPRPEQSSELTGVDTVLLDQWQRAAADPDELPISWLRTGAPAGLLPSRLAV